MKTPTSLLHIAIVLGVVALMLALAGCRMPTSLFGEPQPVSNPTPPATTSSAPSADLSRQAVETVTSYVTALNDLNYAAAYDLLSRDSHTLHTSADFAQQGKQGMPLYDLKTTAATVQGDTATVTVHLVEDPGTNSFHLRREDGAWKVVYRGGGPGMPYAEAPRGHDKGEAK